MSYLPKIVATAIGLAVLFGPVLTGRAEEGDWPEWGPTYATPGLELTLEEVKRESIDNDAAVVYHLLASGFAGNKIYGVWVRRLGRAPELVLTDLHVHRSGSLILGRGRMLEEILFTAVRFARGEPYEIGVISIEGGLRAFAKSIPFPITAKGYGGRCRLTVELLSPKGTTFAIEGEGFDRHEELVTRSQSDGEVIEHTIETTRQEGFLTILLPAVIGVREGPATFSAMGKFCNATVEYQWGPSALEPE